VNDGWQITAIHNKGGRTWALEMVAGLWVQLMQCRTGSNEGG